jgi:Tfp pilus assembly protein PilN
VLLAAASGVVAMEWTLNRQKQELLDTVHDLERQQTTLRAVAGELERLKQRQTSIDEELRFAVQLQDRRVRPAQLLEALSQILPEEAWLTDITESPGQLTIEGNTTSMPSVSEFVSRLRETRLVREPIAIVTTEQDHASAESSQYARAVYRFTINASAITEGA